MLGRRGWKNLPRIDNDFYDWLTKLADLSLIAPFGYFSQGHMLMAAFGGQPVACSIWWWGGGGFSVFHPSQFLLCDVLDLVLGEENPSKSKNRLT